MLRQTAPVSSIVNPETAFMRQSQVRTEQLASHKLWDSDNNTDGISPWSLNPDGEPADLDEAANSFSTKQIRSSNEPSINDHPNLARPRKMQHQQDLSKRAEVRSSSERTATVQDSKQVKKEYHTNNKRHSISSTNLSKQAINVDNQQGAIRPTSSISRRNTSSSQSFRRYLNKSQSSGCYSTVPHKSLEKSLQYDCTDPKTSHPVTASIALANAAEDPKIRGKYGSNRRRTYSESMLQLKKQPVAPLGTKDSSEFSHIKTSPVAQKGRHPLLFSSKSPSNKSGEPYWRSISTITTETEHMATPKSLDRTVARKPALYRTIRANEQAHRTTCLGISSLVAKTEDSSLKLAQMLRRLNKTDSTRRSLGSIEKDSSEVVQSHLHVHLDKRMSRFINLPHDSGLLIGAKPLEDPSKKEKNHNLSKNSTVRSLHNNSAIGKLGQPTRFRYQKTKVRLQPCLELDSAGPLCHNSALLHLLTPSAHSPEPHCVGSVTNSTINGKSTLGVPTDRSKNMSVKTSIVDKGMSCLHRRKTQPNIY